MGMLGTGISISAAAHPNTAFRSSTVHFLGPGLTLLAMSLKLLYEDPPGFRKLPCSVAHLVPVIAWSNWSTEFK